MKNWPALQRWKVWFLGEKADPSSVICVLITFCAEDKTTKLILILELMSFDFLNS